MMRLPRRRLAFALVILSWGVLGLTCEDFVAPRAGAVPVTLRLEIGDEYTSGDFYVAFVDIVAAVEKPVQAVDMTLAWDGPPVAAAVAVPYADFDDDGKLFSGGIASDGSLSGIVDLRHGDTPAEGVFSVARVVIVQQNATEPLTFRASGKLAGPNGTLYQVVISESAVLAPPSL
jgi:hypothetical protein